MIRPVLTAIAALATAPAFAGGDVPNPAPPPVIVPVAAEQDWTGFYAGGQLDYIANAENSASSIGFLTSFTGHLTGVFAGYRYDFGDIVVGGEIDYMVGTYDVDRISPSILLLSPTQEVELLRVGGELGYDFGDVLVYGTAGYAHITMDTGAGINDGPGMFYGLGVDYRVSDRVTVGAELLQHHFSDFPTATALDHDLLTFGVNFAITF